MQDEYHEFKIPKHSGGFRTITAPSEDLKTYQRMIINFIEKTCKVLPHGAAHGFTARRNCKTALEVHQKCGSRWFLKVDIHDFFGSTTNAMILDAMKNQNTLYHSISSMKMSQIVHLCTLNGTLPQGAPTSPLLANLVMTRVDEKIRKAFPRLVYTRYADDMLFSSKTGFDKEYVVNTLATILLEVGYVIATEKTRYGNANGRNWNLGLMYTNELKITVGAKNKKLIKNRIHNFNTKPEVRTIKELMEVNGILGYYKYIEPEYFKDIPLLDYKLIGEKQ